MENKEKRIFYNFNVEKNRINLLGENSKSAIFIVDNEISIFLPKKMVWENKKNSDLFTIGINKNWEYTVLNDDKNNDYKIPANKLINIMFNELKNQ